MLWLVSGKQKVRFPEFLKMLAERTGKMISTEKEIIWQPAQPWVETKQAVWVAVINSNILWLELGTSLEVKNVNNNIIIASKFLPFHLLYVCDMIQESPNLGSLDLCLVFDSDDKIY